MLLGITPNVWHLSPEDSPDLIASVNGIVYLLEVKTTGKNRFVWSRDANTQDQYERLVGYSARHPTFYAVKFMGRTWRFYQIPPTGFPSQSLNIQDGVSWEELSLYMDGSY